MLTPLFLSFPVDTKPLMNQNLVSSVKPRLLLCSQKLATPDSPATPHPTTVIVQAPPAAFANAANVLTVVTAATESSSNNNSSVPPSSATFLAPQPLSEEKQQQLKQGAGSEQGSEAKRVKTEASAS